ncbi:winged helix-turn-helix transcriptional regulator [Nitrospira defluvii]
MGRQAKIFSRRSAPEQSTRMVETIYGCKWSLTVYQLLANGIKRPGEMVRSVEGLTTKVLNECLRKNVAFGIIERIAYNEIPPRVEYVVTPFGRKFIRILDDLDKLQKEIDSEQRRTPR